MEFNLINHVIKSVIMGWGYSSTEEHFYGFHVQNYDISCGYFGIHRFLLSSRFPAITV